MRAWRSRRPRFARRHRPSRAAGATGSSGPRPSAGRGAALVAWLDVEQHEARRVEELVGERLALADLLGAVADVLRRRHRQQAEADGVGAVRIDLGQRIDPGAERLAHPASVRRLDHRMHVDVRERDLAREAQAHHHHPRDPEEEDVARCDQHVGRVEGAQLGRVAGPAKRRERPQRRGEPRVEHVGVALPAVALRCRRRRRRSRRRGTRPAAGGPTTAGG